MAQAPSTTTTPPAPAGVDAPGAGEDAAGAGRGRTGGRHDGRRWIVQLGAYLATIFALVTINFLVPRMMPGDPVQALAAKGSNNFTFGKQGQEALARYYGLDRPLVSQYGRYLSQLAHGDLGRSIVTNAPVGDDLSRRMPWTLLLIGTSLLLATALGLVAGVHSGWRRGRALDRGLLTVLLSVREFPTFLLGSLLLLLFAVKLGWVPVSGAETAFSNLGPAARAVDIGRHLVLPALVLSVGLTAGSFLIMRAGMVNELGADYLLWGRAKGLREHRLKYNYAARNALLPVVSLTALQMGFVVTGDVLIERIFSYPGVGNLIFESINSRDYPAIQGAFLFVAVSVISANGLADLLYRRLDPRTSA
jgi:peptide/nickel transport system permease protein